MPPDQPGVRPAPFVRCVGAVLGHELRSFLHAPLTYIFMAGFLAALAAMTFLVAGYFSLDEASIRPMLAWLPWVAMILVPALAMRAWPDERQDRETELTFTLPLPLAAIVLGKFLAGTLVLLVVLAHTAPLAATATYLGEPDGGVMVAGYLGAALLLGAFYAVALLAAALVREPVGAFVTGAAALFLLLALGWDVLARLLKDHLPAQALAALATVSPARRLETLGRGWLDFGDVAYFVLLTAAALAGTGLVAALRRRGARGHLRGLAGAAGLLAVTAILAALAARLPLGLDLTAEREFTLGEGTLAVLERLPPGVEARLYWSRSEPTVPNDVKRHARRVGDLLRDLAARSGGRLTLETLDPEPDTDAELQALREGVRRVPMTSGDHFYLGASFAHEGRVGRIPYFDLRREGQLEYDVALALNGLTRSRTPKVGLISPLLPNLAAVEDREGLSFLSELRRAYDIAVIPHFTEQLPAGLDVAVLIDTTILRRRMLYAVDQFLMRGGSVILLLDPYLRSNPPSNMVSPEPSTEINDVSDLLLAYGLRYVPDGVVGDASAAAQVSDAQGAMTYPYWLRLREDALQRGHPVTAALNEVFFVEPGELVIEDPRVFQPLVTTGPSSGTLDRKAIARVDPRALAREFAPDGGARVIAAVAQGGLESAFKTPPEDADGSAHIGRGAPTARLFAVADVDWIFDPFALQALDVGGRSLVRPLNDNLSLLLNLVEYAGGDDALISIRSRGRLHRPFTRVAALFAAAEQRYSTEEARLARHIAELETELAALTREAGVQSLENLPASLQAEVHRYRLELLAARKALRDIRRRIREQVDRLGRRVTAINLLAGPLAVLALWIAVSLLRRRRRGSRH